ncbi:CsgG/HfaB family protein [Flammeovirgaceae bacterium SG7u.111]|nr:CsgG/HfaB family protein [Flammeovirgaceae bacterium SG7u.132]WPO35624.1 CsgG/HfaB family protein [Flammeovirgaceae bacterium SG7u.111]
MKNIFFCLLLFSVITPSFSQDTSPGKKIIGVTTFGSSEARNASRYSSSITEIVVDAFTSSNRFTVVDRTNFDDIFSEENLQKGESFIEGEVVEQGKKLGAQFIVTGQLINISVSELYEDEEEKDKKLLGYSGKAHFSIKVIEVETGKIIASESLKGNSDKILMIEIPFGSKEEAIASAIRNSREPIFYFIDEYFPVKAKIFEISKNSKRKVQQVVVTAGKIKGCREGQILKIVETVMVELDGKQIPRNRQVGTLKILSVDDDYFSTCKVLKGKEELMFKLENMESIWVLSGQGKTKFEEFIDAVTIPHELLKD